MNDPLYDLTPDDDEWWTEMAEEAESLSVAIHQDDYERRDRKIDELRHAFDKLAGGETGRL